MVWAVVGASVTAGSAAGRGRVAVGVVGRVVAASLVVEACWCALRSDVQGLVVTVTALLAVAAVIDG